MEPAVGVEIPLQQFQIMIGLDKNKIGIDQIRRNLFPLAEIRQEHHPYRTAVNHAFNHESVGRAGGMMIQLEGPDGKIADGKSPILKRSQDQLPESIRAEKTLAKLFHAFAMDVHRQLKLFDYAQGILADVVAVSMGNDHRIRPDRTLTKTQQRRSCPLHRTQTTIEYQPRLVRPQRQAISAAAAAQTLEIYRHP